MSKNSTTSDLGFPELDLTKLMETPTPKPEELGVSITAPEKVSVDVSEQVNDLVLSAPHTPTFSPESPEYKARAAYLSGDSSVTLSSEPVGLGGILEDFQLEWPSLDLPSGKIPVHEAGVSVARKTIDYSRGADFSGFVIDWLVEEEAEIPQNTPISKQTAPSVEKLEEVSIKALLARNLPIEIWRILGCILSSQLLRHDYFLSKITSFFFSKEAPNISCIDFLRYDALNDKYSSIVCHKENLMDSTIGELSKIFLRVLLVLEFFETEVYLNDSSTSIDERKLRARQILCYRWMRKKIRSYVTKDFIEKVRHISVKTPKNYDSPNDYFYGIFVRTPYIQFSKDSFIYLPSTTIHDAPKKIEVDKTPINDALKKLKLYLEGEYSLIVSEFIRRHNESLMSVSQQVLINISEAERHFNLEELPADPFSLANTKILDVSQKLRNKLEAKRNWD